MPDAHEVIWDEGVGCARCRNKGVPFDGVVRLGSWEGELRRLVLGLKYSAWWEVADPLGRLLAMRMRPLLGWVQQPACIVPMPMPLLRRWTRGLDHAALLASSMGRGLGLPVRPLLTMKHGVLQARSTRSVRRRMGQHRVQFRHRRLFSPDLKSFQGSTIVLVDDVMTTGSTAFVAAKRLRSLNPRRLFLAVAAVSDGGDVDPARRP